MRAEAELGRLVRRLPGRRALVTGAASGLARAFALELARRGWRLGLADLSGDRLERVCAEVDVVGGRATMYTGDVASPEFMDSVLQRYTRDAGGLDLLINNAGVAVAGLVEVTSAED
jgi:NAD(P)-dependent dehydrogenase (short-subunit alcohol dehydrogenase family)